MNDTVLIVDDSLTVRMDLAEAFEAAGFHPLPCATAAETRVALVRQPVALVILDVLLPDGDGLDLLKEIRAVPTVRGAPILLLSTEAEVKDRIRGLERGADDYVGKPYDASYVVARARELLRAREGSAPTSDIATVLVIDDSVTFREQLKAALEEVGYAVRLASNGEEGLRVAAISPPTAVVVDGLMPGIDGATVIRRIRLDAGLRNIPCILLTASEDRSAELSAFDAGADAFVRKEDLEVIVARVAAVLRGTAAQRENADSLLGPKRILAVDDSVTYLQQVASVLRDDGYDVVLAHSGEEAIEMLGAQPVDCILLDLVMPGLDGTEICRRVKATPLVRDIPLIMLTALEDRATMIDGLGTGADDFILKSSEFDVLRARVRAQMRRKQFEAENRRIRDELLKKEIEATEARAAKELAATRATLIRELERKNNELEAFSYSVSHDLRAPLRSIQGFSQILLETYQATLDEPAQDYLRRVCAAARRMGELIDDLLALSRIGRDDLRLRPIDLSAIAGAIAGELQRRDPERQVELRISDRLVVTADERLVKIVFENLLGNAWKFTRKTAAAVIEVGAVASDEGPPAYFVRDNGAGFKMAYVQKLFRPFQRLHSEAEFPGTGIGLATVHRAIERHGGRVWAEATVNGGATFFFTLAPGPRSAP